MKRLQSSSAIAGASTVGGSRGLRFLAAAHPDARNADARATWTLALFGLLFAVIAANLLCLSPRWYSNRFISLVYEPARFVVLTALTGATAVQIFWVILTNKPSARPAAIALNLSAGWVFLPLLVLLYERNSPGLLFAAAMVALGCTLGVRRLLPAPAPQPAQLTNANSALLPSLDGLPPRDSPLLLASSIAVLTQASVLLAAGDNLLLAAYPLAIAVVLFAWRWSELYSRVADGWMGRHPPLRTAVAATILTALTLIPFSTGDFAGRNRHAALKPPPEATANNGYYGIILYPPPKKKQVVAPHARDDSFANSNAAKPVTIPFDGPYWYFKPPASHPGARAHIAHALPTDDNINVRSTDQEPIVMEAHQNLGLPVALDCCSEIDVALTNADTRPGAISIALLLSDSAKPGKPPRFLRPVVIPSSEADPMPLVRPPVKETLHFLIPPSHAPGNFDQITIAFLLSPRHARAGAKVSIDSFELIPKR